MNFDVPDDRRYLESHEWVDAEPGTNAADAGIDGAASDAVLVGISDFAQDELGDVVFVELPEVGDDVAAGDSFGVVESIKAVSDLYAPVSGEVVAVNEALFDSPELVNDDPFGEGWMVAVEPSDPGEFDDLLGPEEYGDQIA